MKLLGFFRERFSILKSGILPGIIVLVVFYTIYGILRLVFGVGLKIFHFSSNSINIVLIVFVLLVYIYLVALLLKSFYLKLLKDKYPEVIFQTNPESGIWLRGFVTGKSYEETIKKSLYKVVYAAHFNPFCFTVEIELDKVYFTGKSAMENVMFNFSGGMYGEIKNEPPK
ncbi:MAG: hypothetical protein M1155_01575 [Patescibacteria group bacterium]|nr:hypothetical protein [Patescibacteria group bacterium]